MKVDAPADARHASVSRYFSPARDDRVFQSTATRVSDGTALFEELAVAFSPRRLLMTHEGYPVTLPPGRAKLATSLPRRDLRRGSMTIGMVRVAPSRNATGLRRDDLDQIDFSSAAKPGSRRAPLRPWYPSDMFWPST